MDHNCRSFVYFYCNKNSNRIHKYQYGLLKFIFTLREHLIILILSIHIQPYLDSKWIQEGERQLLFKINIYFRTKKTCSLLPCGIRPSILQQCESMQIPALKNQVVFQSVFYLDLPSAIFLKTLMTSDSSRPNSSGSVALNLFMHCTWGQSKKTT